MARTNQDRTLWVGGLPHEIWLCVLDHLCTHCHPGPALRPGAVFIDLRKLADRTRASLPSDSRGALQAMTLTCRFFRDLAQKYIGHCVHRSDIKKAAFLRTIHARPDLADSVREISVTSVVEERSILGLCTGVQRLNYIIPTQHIDEDEWSTDSPHWPNVKFGDITLVGKLERLRELSLLPPERMVVDLSRGRFWLENLMKAAPGLRTLNLHWFVDFRRSEFGSPLPPLHIERVRFPDYMGLPENRITKLYLRSTYFRYRALGQLLRNFKHLREFGFVDTGTSRVNVPGQDKTAFPVDGRDSK